MRRNKDHIGKNCQPHHQGVNKNKGSASKQQLQLGVSNVYLILSCAFKPWAMHVPPPSFPLYITTFPPSFPITPPPLSLSLVLRHFTSNIFIHNRINGDGQSGKANEAQVRHQTLAFLPQAQPHRQLRLRHQQRQGTTPCRLRGEVEAAVPRELRRGGPPRVSGAGGQVGVSLRGGWWRGVGGCV